MSYPDHIDPVEREIIDLIVKKALAGGWEIGVYGEGEMDLSRSNEYDLITSEIAATDVTSLAFHLPGMKGSNGFVQLIHGNHWDVISDHTDTPEIRMILQDAEELAASYETLGAPPPACAAPEPDPVEAMFEALHALTHIQGFAGITAITVRDKQGLTHRWEDGKIISERRWPRG